MDGFYGDDIPFFDENGNPVDFGEGNQWRYDRKAAEAAVLQLLNQPDDLDEEEPENVLTARERAILNQELPIACYMVSSDNQRAFAPIEILDFLAQNLFGDKLNSLLIREETLTSERTTVKFKEHAREKQVYRIVAKAVVRLEIKNRFGRKMQHDAIGICGYDMDYETNERVRAEKVAHKGAAADARRTAYQMLGRVFRTRMRDQDELLEAMRQQRRLQAAAKPSTPAATAPAAVSPAKAGPTRTTSRKAKPVPARRPATTPPAVRGTTTQVAKTAPAAKASVAKENTKAPAKTGFTLIGPDGAELMTCPTAAAFIENYVTLFETAEKPELLDAIKVNNHAVFRKIKDDNAPSLRDAVTQAEQAFERHAAELLGFIAGSSDVDAKTPDLPDAPIGPDPLEAAEAPASVEEGAPPAASTPKTAPAPATKLPDLGEPDAADKGAAWAKRLLDAIDDVKDGPTLTALMQRYEPNLKRVKGSLALEIAQRKAKRQKALAA